MWSDTKMGLKLKFEMPVSTVASYCHEHLLCQSRSSRDTFMFIFCPFIAVSVGFSGSSLHIICARHLTVPLSSEGFSTRRTCLTAWKWCKLTLSKVSGAWWTWSVAGGSTSSPPCSLDTSLLSGLLTTTTASSSANTERTCPSNSTDCQTPQSSYRPGQETVFSFSGQSAGWIWNFQSHYVILTSQIAL